MFKSTADFLKIHRANGFDTFTIEAERSGTLKVMGNAIHGGRFVIAHERVPGWGKSAAIYEISNSGGAVRLTGDSHIAIGAVLNFVKALSKYDFGANRIGAAAIFEYGTLKYIDGKHTNIRKRIPVTITHFGTGNRMWGITNEGLKIGVRARFVTYLDDN